MNTERSTEQIIPSIVATLGSLSARPITPTQSQGSSESVKRLSEEQRKRRWLDKWLCLKITHPQLRKLEESVYQFAKEYATRPSRGKTLVLFGENGCGKTRTARALYRWASRCAMHIPLVNGESDTRLATSSWAHWPEVVDGFKRQQFFKVDELVDSELMIVDDIGAEHDPSGFGSEQLCLLLSRREFRWNLFTTNLPPHEWATRLERRIASRLFRNAEHVDLSAVPDFSTI